MTDQPDYESELKNLVCILHRDGGHRIEAVGLEQATAEAKEIASACVQLRDITQHQAMTDRIDIAEQRKWCEERREEAFLICKRTLNCDYFNTLQRNLTLCDEVERLREENSFLVASRTKLRCIVHAQDEELRGTHDT